LHFPRVRLAPSRLFATILVMENPVFDIALALVHQGDRWLVAKRKHDTHLGGLWEFPGGKRYAHETHGEAALRELREECAVDAEVERVLPRLAYDYDDRTVHLTPVICRWRRGEPRALASDACRWATVDELSQLPMPHVNATIIQLLTGAS
jgi:mutator protein MutT